LSGWLVGEHSSHPMVCLKKYHGPTHGIRTTKMVHRSYNARMTSRDSLQPIIQTKFCIPHLTPDIVSRQRLLSLMDESMEVPLEGYIEKTWVLNDIERVE
jgi:hypothetical protein